VTRCLNCWPSGWRAKVHEGDTPARWGRQLRGVAAISYAPDETMALVAQDQEAASLPFALEGRKQHVSLSLGASTFPQGR